MLKLKRFHQGCFTLRWVEFEINKDNKNRQKRTTIKTTTKTTVKIITTIITTTIKTTIQYKNKNRKVMQQNNNKEKQRTKIEANRK